MDEALTMHATLNTQSAGFYQARKINMGRQGRKHKHNYVYALRYFSSKSDLDKLCTFSSHWPEFNSTNLPMLP